MTSIWPPRDLPPVELEVPEGTVAVVYIRHGDGGDLLASYAEARGRVPAPREQVADALTELAIVLMEQADELDAEAAR